MGWDIHMFVETRQSENDAWRYTDVVFKTTDEYTCKEVTECTSRQLNRNYALFAILANVRNRLDHDVSISHPRGWPDDLSPQLHKLLVLDDYSGWPPERTNGLSWCMHFDFPGEHSESWLLLSEVLPRMDEIDDVLFRDFVKRLIEIQPNAQNVRLVFNFDS